MKFQKKLSLYLLASAISKWTALVKGSYMYTYFDCRKLIDAIAKFIDYNE